mmetsp:Transcript_12773/g.26512  ORF Transcript_12773/g.26512 Transcript_12773/m.26512 type:complete len:227 (+) Transcript_12773:422-1102(+)
MVWRKTSCQMACSVMTTNTSPHLRPGLVGLLASRDLLPLPSHPSLAVEAAASQRMHLTNRAVMHLAKRAAAHPAKRKVAVIHLRVADLVPNLARALLLMRSLNPVGMEVPHARLLKAAAETGVKVVRAKKKIVRVSPDQVGLAAAVNHNLRSASPAGAGRRTARVALVVLCASVRLMCGKAVQLPRGDSLCDFVALMMRNWDKLNNVVHGFLLLVTVVPGASLYVS